MRRRCDFLVLIRHKCIVYVRIEFSKINCFIFGFISIYVKSSLIIIINNYNNYILEEVRIEQECHDRCEFRLSQVNSAVLGE